MSSRLVTTWGFAAWLVAAPVAAADDQLNVSGQVDFGIRYHSDDGLYLGQSSNGVHPFFSLGLEGDFVVGQGKVAFAFSGLGDEENGRSYANIGQLYYTQSFENWDILAGFNTENWSVSESRSVVNVLNPRNRSDPITGKSYLGTPMINANFHTDFGTFSGYALTGFVEGNHIRSSSRHRQPIIPDSDDPVFEEGNGRHLDFALRYENNFNLGDGAIDFSASYFNGTSRTPGCTTVAGTGQASCVDAILSALAVINPGAPAPGSSSSTFWKWMDANATDTLLHAASAAPAPDLRLYYPHIQQVGITSVYARDDLQLRFEGAFRHTDGSNNFEAVVGGDYAFNEFAGSEGTLTVAVEYLYNNDPVDQGYVVFDNDLFVGLNYRFNNAYDTQAKFAVFHDLETQARIYQAGLYSRLSDNLALSINASKVTSRGWNDPLAFIKNDNYAEIVLSAFF